jgi:hypothetical protein
MDARHAEARRVLRERDRVTTFGCEAANLLGAFLGVEERHDPARDETLGIRAAPLVDVPVVVRLDHHEVDVAVGAEVQHLPGEARPVGEVEPGELTARRHVAHALVDVVAAGAHVLVPVGVHVEHLGRLPRHRVQPEVSAADVAVVPLLRPVGEIHHPRCVLAVPRRHMTFEHVGGLADVIVDRDEDQVVALHDDECTPRDPH